MINHTHIPRELSELESEYEIVGELGRGGTAVVYLARDRQLGREVAIKVIRSHFLEDEEALVRFAREARMVAQLEHPSIVSIFSVRQLGDGSLALVMQHIPGRTLKETIRRTGPLPFLQVQRILRDLGEALDCAHRRGVIHRDVKPENVLLDENTGRAMLFDFGIARQANSHTQITLTGVALGTPAYMSPEQIDGADVDGRSDLYSLGIVGWEMLSGRRPWEGESLYSIIFKQKAEPLPAPREIRPDIPDALSTAIEGALQKDPARRWPSARDFVAELDAGEEGAGNRRSAEEEERRGAVLAAIDAARATPPASSPEAETVRFHRPKKSSEPVSASHPAPPRRRGLHRAVLLTLTLLLAGSAAVIAAMDGWGFSAAPERQTTPAAAMDSPDALPNTEIALAERTPIGPEGGDALADVPLAPDSTSAATLTETVDTAGPAPSGDAAEAKLPGRAAETEAPPPLPLEERPGSTSAPTVASTGNPAEERATVAESPPAPRVDPRSAARESPRLVAGGSHSCLVSRSGTAFCWGGNEQGQLGAGSRERLAGTSIQVDAPTLRALSAGVSHTCGLTPSGEVFCWGANESGQLGDGSTTLRSSPARVSASHRFAGVWAAASHTCALTPEGNAFCWGENTFGQLGTGGRAGRPTPAAVAGDLAFGRLATGWQHTCGIATDGIAYCWGHNQAGQLGIGNNTDRSAPTPISGDVRFREMAAGSAHTCALTFERRLLCWGSNDHGQLGDGGTTDRSVPTPLGGGTRFASVTLGGAHTCGLTPRGEAFCWGRNSYGQLGDGSTVDRVAPVRVEGGHTFATLQASGAHTCGITGAGEHLCWGYNVAGQLGDGTRIHRSSPVLVTEARQSSSP